MEQNYHFNVFSHSLVQFGAIFLVIKLKILAFLVMYSSFFLEIFFVNFLYSLHSRKRKWIAIEKIVKNRSMKKMERM